MVLIQDNTFSNVRRTALSLWKSTTFRNCEGINDDITGSWECLWQDRATSEKYNHISIFCSIGEWATNITDILKDGSLDDFSYLNDDHRQALFRYYTRMLLVTSEILTDFEDVAQRVMFPDSSASRVRGFLSGTPGELHALIGFINNVCKHKAVNAHFHLCNHHLPIWFNDCSIPCPFENPIHVGNLKFDHPGGIVMPKLGDLIKEIAYCYNRIDENFRIHPESFTVVCDKYAFR